AVNEVQFLAGARAGSACEGGELLRIARHEERRVAIRKAELGTDRLGAFLADVLGDGAGAFQPLVFLAPDDVAKSRLSFALCPAVHAVAEGAGAARPGRNGPDFRLGIAGENIGENLEPGAAEVLRDVLHL